MLVNFQVNCFLLVLTGTHEMAESALTRCYVNAVTFKRGQVNGSRGLSSNLIGLCLSSKQPAETRKEKMKASSLKPEEEGIARAGLKRLGTSTSKLWLSWGPITVLLAHRNIVVLCKSNHFTPRPIHWGKREC